MFRGRPVTATLVPQLVSHYANTVGQAFFVDTGKQTTNLASVSLAKLSTFPVPVPPSEESKVMSRVIADLMLPGLTLERCLATLSEHTREADRSILAKAFRGELVPQSVAPDGDPTPAETPGSGRRSWNRILLREATWPALPRDE